MNGAIRELKEETSLTDSEFRWDKKHFITSRYSRGKIASYYVAAVNSEEVKMLPNSKGIAEHHEYRWVTYEEASKLVIPRLKEVLDWSQELIQ